MNHDYRFLSTEDKSVLRLERVRALEFDLFRAELAYEDALSDAERESLAADIAALQARLSVHYGVLAINDEKESSPANGG